MIWQHFRDPPTPPGFIRLTVAQIHTMAAQEKQS